jgi:hypothetical protein
LVVSFISSVAELYQPLVVPKRRPMLMLGVQTVTWGRF